MFPRSWKVFTSPPGQIDPTPSSPGQSPTAQIPGSNWLLMPKNCGDDDDDDDNGNIFNVGWLLPKGIRRLNLEGGEPLRVKCEQCGLSQAVEHAGYSAHSYHPLTSWGRAKPTWLLLEDILRVLLSQNTPQWGTREGRCQVWHSQSGSSTVPCK